MPLKIIFFIIKLGKFKRNLIEKPLSKKKTKFVITEQKNKKNHESRPLKNKICYNQVGKSKRNLE